MLNRRDLNELRNSVPDVLLSERLEQVEIDDNTAVWVECSDAVLVLLRQVPAHLNGDGRVDHADQRCRESHVRSRATIKRARRTADISDEAAAHQQRGFAP